MVDYASTVWAPSYECDIDSVCAKTIFPLMLTVVDTSSSLPLYVHCLKLIKLSI